MQIQKTKFCVANNNSRDCISRLVQFAPFIQEFFGSAPPEISGSARVVRRHIDAILLEEFVREAGKLGIGYNVLLNSIAYPELFSRGFREKIRDFFVFLSDIGATAVTIADIALMEFVAREKNRIGLTVEIVASSWCDIMGPTKAKRIEKKGADRIVLHQDINRNFSDLKAIQGAVTSKIELLANNGCTYRCAARQSHRMFQSLNSTNQSAFSDPFRNECIKLRRDNPVEILLSPTIRPEDIRVYEQMSFHLFKIAGRLQSTDWLEKAVQAYIARDFTGSLPELAYTNHGEKMPFIDNKKLDGFLEFVAAGSPLEYSERVREFYKKNFCE